MKFLGDDRKLLRGLWSAVQSAGGSPSVNMILKMARVAGASFDDKASRAVLFGDRKNIGASEAAPMGEVDEDAVSDTSAPNLFAGLVDPLELEPVNDAATLVPASDIAPQEVLAPGIARLMELSKKAKEVNAAAAMRAAAMPTQKAIRYIFPSERKT